MAKRMKTKSLKPIVAEIKLLQRTAVRTQQDAARSVKELKRLEGRVKSICRSIFLVTIP